jgi:maltose O-acetyltransferase
MPEGDDYPLFRPFNLYRAWCCGKIFKSCGRNVNVHRLARFGSGKNIQIGNKSNLGFNIYVNGRGGVNIGDNVLMGHDIIIYSGTHTFKSLDVPIQEQDMRYEPVYIGDDVWIGARTIIMPGITIGKGCVIGANSVVVKDIEPYSVAAGSPARIIKKRRRKD